MILINFHPESDKKEFVDAAQEYTQIWQTEGKRFFNEIEKVSGLKFKTQLINAVTFEGHSFSLPLRLKSSYSYIHKKATLIHELCHRLLLDNNFYIFDYKNLAEDIHKIIDLILYDIWENVMGKEVANESKDTEIGHGDPTYKNAWDWALSFSFEERQAKFREMTSKYANYKKPLKTTKIKG